MADNPVWIDGTGVRRELIRVDDETFAITASADASSVIDANKQDNNHGHNKSPDGSLYHIARIPPIVYEIWRSEYGVDALNVEHKDGVRKLLNSPEWRDLRTWGGYL